MRICKKCNIQKLLSEFRKLNYRRNGIEWKGYRHECLQCYRDRNRIWLPVAEGKKICKKCFLVKFLDEMAKSNNCTNGRKNICKKCVNKRYKKKVQPLTNSGWYKAGEDHPNFIDGKTTERHRSVMGKKKYVRLRQEMLKIFLNTCAHCPEVDKLQMHHIIPLWKNSDLAFNKENLIILCPPCHTAAERSNLKEAKQLQAQLSKGEL